MKTSIVKIVTLCAAILSVTVLQSQAENRDAVKRWVPAEIGQGAFSLKPDKTIVYKTVDKLGQPAELTLHAFLPEGYKPSDKRPAALFFHGGGWHGGTPDQFYPQSRYLALRGMVAFSVQYRTIGAFKTTPKECVADGKSAVRWVRQHAAELGVDPNRIAAGGGSAGGHIAAATALVDGFEDTGEDLQVSCRPDALLLYNPVFDNGPEGFGYPLVRDYWKAISPIDNIDAQAPPAIVFLGTKDQFIPAETGRRFERLMKEQGRRCDLHLYEGKPHGFFNIWVSRENLAETIIRLDRFLTSLGYLEGAAILQVAPSAPKTAAVKSAPHKGLFPGQVKDWHGFDMYVNGGNRVVVPKHVADGKPWVWRARFWGHEPQFDIAMLERGYHVVYCDVGGLFGNAEAVARWDAFYDYLRFEHLFADRVVLEGMSRGGLIIYNWAAANPEKVAAIYADAPVMDFKSWPGINDQILTCYGFRDQQEAEAYALNPVDNLAQLAKAGIPILHVVGDDDDVVPVAENTALAEARYKAMGGTFKVIHKPGVGHHPHSLKDPQPIVDFVIKHDKGHGDLAADEIVSDQNFILRGDVQNSRIQFETNKRGHVAFIGGSITEMHGYRPMVCEMLKKRFPETEFNFTQAGISSTCSDTGAFRLQRDVLSQGPLDMLFVEFAVNDDQDAQQDYNDALRGMEGIIVQARRHNPNVDIVMTFFANQNILDKLKQNQNTPSIAAHSKVAEYYAVSVNHLAQELADLIATGKMDWKKFGGVHPNNYGNTMCATMIGNALLQEWSKTLPTDAKPQAYPVVKAIDEKSYVNGRFLPFADVAMDGNWKVGVPNWAEENKGEVRPRFQNSPMIYSSQAHATLTIDFSGTAIGAYLLAGPDAGIIRCTVDGKQTKEIDTLHPYSRFNYPMTVMFFSELADGEHTLELEILGNRPGRINSGGTALRVLGITAN